MGVLTKSHDCAGDLIERAAGASAAANGGLSNTTLATVERDYGFVSQHWHRPARKNDL
jgi:hypothetical protein